MVAGVAGGGGFFHVSQITCLRQATPRPAGRGATLVKNLLREVDLPPEPALSGRSRPTALTVLPSH